MPIELKTIACPSCGSTEIHLMSDTRGICQFCGATFAVYASPAAAPAANASPQGGIISLAPEYTEQEFIRALWIGLERDGAPIGVFDSDFTPVAKSEKRLTGSELDSVCRGRGRGRNDPNMYMTPRYDTTIKFNGETYHMYTYPIGPMNILGDRIRSEDDTREYREMREEETDRKWRESRDAATKKVTQETNTLSFVTLGVLLASFIVSCFIHVLPLVIALFAASVLMFVLCTIKVEKAAKRERDRLYEESSIEDDRYCDDVADYTEAYKKRRKEALDRKLTENGLAPRALSDM